MFEFSLHTCSKCSPSSSLMFSFLVSMPTLQCWWQPAWGEVDPCWHMPMASMWFFPYCNDSIPHEAICPEYQEFGSLIVFQTRLKTRGSSDSWQCQKCKCQDSSGFLKLCWRLELLLPYLLSLPSVTVYNLSVVWLTDKNYSVVKTRWNLTCDSVSRYITGTQSLYSGRLLQVKKYWVTTWLMQVRGQLKKFQMVSPRICSSPLHYNHVAFFCCCLFNFGERFSLRLSPCSDTLIYYLKFSDEDNVFYYISWPPRIISAKQFQNYILSGSCM